jgi:hypothetical protein
MDDYPMKSSSEYDWRAREDHSTLMRAAEVMADRVRVRAVIKCNDQKKKEQTTLNEMLAGYRSTGVFGKKGIVKVKRGRGPAVVVIPDAPASIASGVTQIQYQSE